MSNRNSINKLPNVFFDTLGCAKNSVDTSKMESLLRSNSIKIVSDAKKADVIVLNTCAFIEAATQESIDTFFEYRNFYTDKKIIVCGCLVSRYSDNLKKSLNEADAFISCVDEDKICDVIESLNVNPQYNYEEEAASASVFAYVKISDGCNRRCSYCTIPYIRGKYKSSPYEEIREDVASQQSAGAKEIILVAQDCGMWGSDFNNKNLSWLVNNLCNEFPNLKFRLLYVYPETIDDELIDSFINNDNLINYIDMPMQHSNPEIIKLMGRRGGETEFLELAQSLRNKIPDITLRSTFIAGYPGESDDQFDELCDFVQKINFDYLGCFEYSQEEGTRAAEMPNQVSSSEKYSRTNQLREIADEISLSKIYDRVGKFYEILIEGEDEGRYFGRAYFQAPDIDGVVFISEYNNKKLNVGEYVNVKIVDTEAYDLVGVLVD